MHQKINYKSLLEGIIMIAAIIATLAISIKFGFIDSLKPENKNSVLIMIGTMFMAFVVIGFHELGHIVMGLIHGFKFQLFVIGPLGIKKENNRIKFYLNKNLAHYGGLAATSPKEYDEHTAKKFGHILLAGPIASILFSVLCFITSYYIGIPLGIYLYIGGLISIAIFFATTIPSKTGVFFTDRKRYQRLIKPGKDQLVEIAMLKIIANYSIDDSYKNIDINNINTLISDDIPFIKFFGMFNLICYQIEHFGSEDSETSDDYAEYSKNMSKNLVTAFNKEISKMKSKSEHIA